MSQESLSMNRKRLTGIGEEGYAFRVKTFQMMAIVSGIHGAQDIRVIDLVQMVESSICTGMRPYVWSSKSRDNAHFQVDWPYHRYSIIVIIRYAFLLKQGRSYTR